MAEVTTALAAVGVHSVPDGHEEAMAAETGTEVRCCIPNPLSSRPFAALPLQAGAADAMACLLRRVSAVLDNSTPLSASTGPLTNPHSAPLPTASPGHPEP